MRQAVSQEPRSIKRSGRDVKDASQKSLTIYAILMVIWDWIEYRYCHLGAEVLLRIKENLQDSGCRVAASISNASTRDREAD